MALRFWKNPTNPAMMRLYVSEEVLRTLSLDPDEAKIWIEPSEKLRSGWAIRSRGDVSPAGKGAVFHNNVMGAAGITASMPWDDLVAQAQKSPKRRAKPPSPAKRGYQSALEHMRGNRSEGRSQEAASLDIASIKMNQPVTILVDHREPAALIELLRENEMVTVESVSLELGDFEVQDADGNRLLIERKRCDASSGKTDFEVSIQDDGRLFDQSERLKLAQGTSDRQVIPVVILEGDLYANSTTMLCQQIDGAVSFLSTIQRISLLPTCHIHHTAYLIVKLAGHFVGGLYTPVTLHKAKPKALFEQQKYVLEAFPGISAKSAELLLREFGTVRKVLTATRTELLSIKGMGPKRVDALMAVLEGGPQSQ